MADIEIKDKEFINPGVVIKNGEMTTAEAEAASLGSGDLFWDSEEERFFDGNKNYFAGLRDTGKKINTVVELEGDIPSWFETLFSATPKRDMLGYKSAGDGGGGELYWDADRDKQDHDSVIVISPTWDGTGSYGDPDNNNWHDPDPSDTGTGVWVRNVTELTPEMAGVVAGEDHTDAFINFVSVSESNKIPIELNNNEYICNKPISTDWFHVMGSGRINRTSPASEKADAALLEVGTTDNIGSYHTVDSDVLQGSNVIESASIVSELEVNDLISIKTDKEFENSGHIQGELALIRRIEGNFIYTSDFRQDEYLIGDNVRVAKIEPSTFIVEGELEIDHKPANPDENTKGIEINYALYPRGRILSKNVSMHSLAIRSSYAPYFEVLAENNAILDPGANVTGEGQTIIVNAGTIYGEFRGMGSYTRHAIAQGPSGAYDGIPWENKFIGFKGMGGGNTYVYDAHGGTGSCYWIDCIAYGGVVSDPDLSDQIPSGFLLGAKRNYVQNCKTFNCATALSIRGDVSYIETLDIDGLHITEGGTGVSINQEDVEINNLNINNIKGTLTQEDSTNHAVSIINGMVNNWSFWDINLLRGNNINIGPNSTVPSELVVNRAAGGFDSLQSISSETTGFRIRNDNINSISFYDIHLVNSARFLEVDCNGIDLLKLENCNNSNAANQHIILSNDIDTLIMTGGVFNDIQSIDGPVITALGNINHALLKPDKIIGSNLTVLLNIPNNTVGKYINSGDLSSIETVINAFNDPEEVINGTFQEGDTTRRYTRQKNVGVISLSEQRLNLKWSPPSGFNAAAYMEIDLIGIDSSVSEMGLFTKRLFIDYRSDGTLPNQHTEIHRLGSIGDSVTGYYVHDAEIDTNDLIIPIQRSAGTEREVALRLTVWSNKEDVIPFYINNITLDTPVSEANPAPNNFNDFYQKVRGKNGFVSSINASNDEDVPRFDQLTATNTESTAPGTDPSWTDVQTALDDIASRLDSGGV